MHMGEGRLAVWLFPSAVREKKGVGRCFFEHEKHMLGRTGHRTWRRLAPTHRLTEVTRDVDYVLIDCVYCKLIGTRGASEVLYRHPKPIQCLKHKLS